MGSLITNNNFVVDGDTLPTPRAIHYLAESAAGITGIAVVYDYGSNVADVPVAHLPALLMAPQAVVPERVGGGELWRGTRIINGLLLIKLYDENAPTQYLPYLEPDAMLFGDRFHQWFNIGATAHARRQTLCANIGCHDVVLSDATYGGIEWGGRGYLGWRLQWQVHWRGYEE